MRASARPLRARPLRARPLRVKPLRARPLRVKPVRATRRSRPGNLPSPLSTVAVAFGAASTTTSPPTAATGHPVTADG